MGEVSWGLAIPPVFLNAAEPPSGGRGNRDMLRIYVEALQGVAVGVSLSRLSSLGGLGDFPVNPQGSPWRPLGRWCFTPWRGWASALSPITSYPPDSWRVTPTLGQHRTLTSVQIRCSNKEQATLVKDTLHHRAVENGDLIVRLKVSREAGAAGRCERPLAEPRRGCSDGDHLHRPQGCPLAGD